MDWTATYSWEPTNGVEPSFKPLAQVPLAAVEGLLLGYSVFTTFRWPLPQQGLAAHVQRVWQQAHALRLALPQGAEAGGQAVLLEDLHAVLAKVALRPSVWRLTLTPCTGALGVLSQAGPRFPFTAWLSCRGAAPLLASSLPPPQLHLHPTLWAEATPPVGVELKHGSWLPRLLLAQQGPAGTTSLWLNTAGEATEALSANVLWWLPAPVEPPDKLQAKSQGFVVQVPPSSQVLAGITQAQVVQQAKALGLTVVQAPCTPAVVAKAQGAWCTNSVQGVVPVAQVGGRVLPWPPALQALAQQLYSQWFASQIV